MPSASPSTTVATLSGAGFEIDKVSCWRHRHALVLDYWYRGQVFADGDWHFIQVAQWAAGPSLYMVDGEQVGWFRAHRLGLQRIVRRRFRDRALRFVKAILGLESWRRS